MPVEQASTVYLSTASTPVPVEKQPGPSANPGIIATGTVYSTNTNAYMYTLYRYV